MSAVELQRMNNSRSHSSRFVRKGAMILETYKIARCWDRTQSVDENMQRVRDENPTGARSAAWLHEVIQTLAIRFRWGNGLDPLILLAQANLPIEQWRDCLLWHLGQQDAIWFDFLTTWLDPAYRDGIVQIRTADVEAFVIAQTVGQVARGKGLSSYGVTRASRDLLRMAVDFGLLQGSSVRAFAGYRLSEVGFLYALHALAEREANGQRIIEAPEWQMFLMSAADVEQELFHLHQYQRLDFQVAGSLIQLRLPYPNLISYAESMAHG